MFTCGDLCCFCINGLWWSSFWRSASKFVCKDLIRYVILFLLQFDRKFNTISNKISIGFTRMTASIGSSKPIFASESTYSSTGFLYLTNSMLSNCSDPLISYGIAVNKCILSDSFSYKLQITGGKLYWILAMYIFLYNLNWIFELLYVQTLAVVL